MALQGNLRDFSLPQLLNLISLARKTGTLVVESPQEIISLSFRDGQLAYARDGVENDGLLNVLHRQDKIDSTQHRLLHQRYGRLNEKELGLTLVNASYLKQKDILLSLQNHYTAILHQLSAWAEGRFSFESDRLPPQDRITVRLNLENLILEVARLEQEEVALQDEIPDLGMVLRFTHRSEGKLHQLQLTPQERRVISAIDSQSSIRQIADLNQLSDIEIRRLVYHLLQAGVVEMVRPPGSRSLFHPHNVSSRPPASPTAQKSRINRLITRLLAFSPSD